MMQLQNYTFLHLVYTVFFAAWVLYINIFGSTVDTRSYVSLWMWGDLNIPLRWSCSHFGFAADYLQSRSSILERTIREQCRSTQENRAACVFDVPMIREFMAVERLFRPLCA